MRRLRLIGFLASAGLAAPVCASDIPRYEPAPAWIAAPDKSIGSQPDGALIERIDQQIRVSEGTVWTYSETAIHALSADALARIGTITFNWQPYQGDIVIHRVEIIRDGQRIDVLKAGQKFTVIRREQGLERLEMDGKLTATLQVEGLRVGDVLEWAFSTTVKDAALKGNVQAGALAMSEPFKVGYERVRFLWPTGAPIKWRAYPTGAVATESDRAGWHDVTVKLPAPKPPELPGDAPPRFHRLPVVEMSSFATWADVSKTTASLYVTTGLITPGSPLAQEVAQIEKASSDPAKRAAAALILVQERVRYFANGMNGGNYVPQTPAQTWSAGYGDCKAKTLLLLAMLRAMDIAAEPVTASIGQGDFVADRLPSLEAFNHILVRAHIAGQDFWMDGTGRGSQLEDLQDPPPFRWVLPVRPEGAELLQLPFAAPARPSRTVTATIDSSAAIGLPAPFAATVTIHGAAADSLRVAAAQLDKEALGKLALLSMHGAIGLSSVAVTQSIGFDAASSTATINVTGITGLSWQREEHRYRYRPTSSVAGLSLNPDRSRTAWKDIPVSTEAAGRTQITTRIMLPAGGARLALQGDPTLDLDMPARHLLRTTTLAGPMLTVSENSATTGAEMQPAEIPAARTKLTAAQNRIARLETTTDYPAEYLQVEAAKRAHKLDKLTSLYAAWIANKPEDVDRYIARSHFFEQTFQWQEALADLDKAVAMDASAPHLLQRAALLERIGDNARAATDYTSVLALEPESKPAMRLLAIIKVDSGQTVNVLEGIDAQISNAGEDKAEWLNIKAQVLAREGQNDAAIAMLDEAITNKPADSALLNSRCRTKALLNVQLENALQDCNQAIELSSKNPAIALDSRALVYLRLNRLTQALADVNAALDMRPNVAGLLFLRAAVERKSGDAQAADTDLMGAKLIAPQIVAEYAHWKIAV